MNLADADIIAYHKNRESFDTTFVLAVLRAQDTQLLENLKARNPGKCCANQWNDWGYLPDDCVDFDPSSYIDSRLVQRRQYKHEGKYVEADAIKAELVSRDYEIRDDRGGTNWLHNRT